MDRVFDRRASRMTRGMTVRLAANEDGFGTDDGRRAEAGHERALMDA